MQPQVTGKRHLPHPVSLQIIRSQTGDSPLGHRVLHGENLLVMPHTDRPADVRAAAKQACDLGLLHIFRCGKGTPTVFSHYDPVAETIRPVAGWFLDQNGVIEYTSPQHSIVKSVLLLGSNHLLWGDPRPVPIVPPDGLRIVDSRLSVPMDGSSLPMLEPENGEIVAFASTLHAKRIFDRHAIPATIMYMPSDLPQATVRDIALTREAYKREKTINSTMRRLLGEYGLSQLPPVSNQELAEKPSLLAQGKAIWYSLESEFRNQAARILEKLIGKGIEGMVEEHFPGGLGEWRRINAERNDSWQLHVHDGTYYVNFIRTDHQSLYIPIGSEISGKDGAKTAGSPKCAMITSSMMRKFQEYGFSHVLAAFHSEEVPIASAGFFLARRLFGVGIHAYALSINRHTLMVDSCGRDGKHAFLGRLYDPKDIL